MAKPYKVAFIATFLSLFLLAYYQYCKTKAWWSFPLYDDGLRLGEVGDKVIVMAKLAVEDTSWVNDNLQKYVSPGSSIEVVPTEHY